MSDTDSTWHKIELRIPFASREHAKIARDAINVDPELQPRAVKRTLNVDESVLIATFSTLTIRLARLTVNSFLENVDLVIRTLAEFGEEAMLADQRHS